MIAVDRLLLEREMRRRGAAFENTIYDVSLPDGTAFTVVPRQLQLNPCKFLLLILIIIIDCHTKFLTHLYFLIHYFIYLITRLNSTQLSSIYLHTISFVSDGQASECELFSLLSWYATEHPYRVHKHRGLCRPKKGRPSHNRQRGYRMHLRG